MNNLVLLIFDSVRYDLFLKAKTPHIRRLGKIEKRYSYASWTSPSHFVYAMGLLPHRQRRHVFATKSYNDELIKWKTRLNLKKLRFRDFLPELSFPKTLSAMGYETHGLVSMPVLNPATPLGNLFDTYELMPAHNDFAGIVRRLEFPKGRPQFYFVNVGETHYPYLLPGEKASKWPKIHGLHGVLKNMDRKKVFGKGFFTPADMKILKDKQIGCIEYLDHLVNEVYSRCPKNTWIVITSDHGELFGEDGFFGHGPIMHEKVFEVPFVEGPRPSAAPFRPIE